MEINVSSYDSGLFMDESGSMTHNFSQENRYFIVSMVYTKEKGLLKKSYKKFVSSHYKQLLDSDRNNKMFKNGKFCELKGSSMTQDIKKEFVSYLCQKPNFSLFYIVVDNKYVDRGFYKNTARAFNYLVKLSLVYLINKGYLPKNVDIDIQIDERNVRTGAKSLLKEYLNTELQLDQKLTGDIEVSYYDSSNNQIIQIADVFANLYYSQIKTEKYTEEFKLLKECGILKYEFKFPKSIKK